MKRKILALLVVVLMVFSLASCSFDDFKMGVKDVIGEELYLSMAQGYHDFMQMIGLEQKPDPEPPHEHNFVDGKCECGETDPNYQPPHEHEYDPETGKCECGETDPNYQPPHEHEYDPETGKCECGATDPNYQPPHEHEYDPETGKCECGATDPTLPDGTEEKPFTVTVPGEVTVNYPEESDGVWYTFTATEAGKVGITFSISNVVIGYPDGNGGMGYTNPASYAEFPVEAGVTYLVSFATGDYAAAEFTVSAEYVVEQEAPKLGLGANTVIFTQAEIDAGSADRVVVITSASKYQFKGDIFVQAIVAADGTVMVKNEDHTFDLAEGTYTITFGLFSVFQTVADIPISVTVVDKNATDDPEDPENPTVGPLDTEASDFVIGENTVTVTDADIEAGGMEFTIVVTAAGTFSFESNDLAIQVVTMFGPQYVGSIDLQPGTYTVNIISAYLETAGAGDYTFTLSYTAPQPADEGSEENPIEVTLPAENLETEGDSFGYIWYTFTSTEEGYLIVNYSNANSWVTYYVAGDSYNSTSGSEEQYLKFEVQANTTYVIGLGVYGPEEDVTASLSFEAATLPKPGEKEKPIDVYAGDEINCEYAGGNDPELFVWYKYNPWIDGTLTITMGGRAIVKYGTDLENLATATNQQTITLDISASVPVYIAVQSSSLIQETITFSLEAIGYPGSDSNPHVAVEGDNTGAIPNGAWATWFKYYAASNGTITFTYEGINISINYEAVPSGTAFNVEAGVEYYIQITDWADDATDVAFNLVYAEAAPVEIEGELVKTDVLLTPGNFAWTEYVTFTATEQGKYIVMVTGKDASTYFQIYNAVTQSGDTINAFPHEVVLAAGATLEYRLFGWDDEIIGKEVTVEIYYAGPAEVEEPSEGSGTESDPYPVIVPGDYICEFPGGVAPIWYSFVATSNGTVVLSSTYGVNAWLQIGSNPMFDMQNNEGNGLSLEYQVVVGNTYYVAVGDWAEGVCSIPFNLAYKGEGGDDVDTPATGSNTDPFIITESGNFVTPEVPNYNTMYFYAYTNNTNSDVIVTINVVGDNFWISYGVGDISFLDTQLAPGAPLPATVNVASGATLYIGVSIYDTAGTVEFSVDIEIAGQVPGIQGTGVNSDPYIIPDLGEYTASAPQYDSVYYAYINAGTEDITVSITVSGDNYWVQYGTMSFMLLNDTLQPNTTNTANVTIPAGGTLFMTVATYSGDAGDVTFTIGEAVEISVPEKELVIGNNSIDGSNVNFVYTAENDITLVLTAGAAIMGPVEITYTVNDGDIQILALSSEATVTLAAGDKLVVYVVATGYSSITVSEPHTHVYESVVTNPTCEDKGYTTHTCECGDSYTDTEVAALGHSYDWTHDGNGSVVGTCKNDASHTITKATADFLDELYALAKDTSYEGTVILSGYITSIDTAYSSSYGNITVTIIVEDNVNRLIQCFRLKGDDAASLKKGDYITVSGIVKNYNSTIEFDSGCTIVEYVAHTEHTYNAATCTEPKTCKYCGATDGEPAGHVDAGADGKCDVCSADLSVQVYEETTAITATTGALASDALTIAWESDNFTFVGAKASSSTAIRTSDSDHYRVYVGSTFTISSKNGQGITKIVINSTGTSYATPWETACTTPGVTVTVSGTVVTVTVDSGTVTEVSFTCAKQMRLKDVTVTYQ
ncbi:MAG: hypothetical protein IKC87_01700 [Clostridia bacterium]|nr:hypothetical protein [Clostridia bacterium]